MRVSELITILQGKNQDLFVMVEGYEGGLCDLESKKIKNSKATLNVSVDDYCGPHQADYWIHDRGHEVVDCLILGR